MTDLSEEEKRAVEAALAILQRPEDHQPLTNRLMLACNMAYHERTAVYGYLAGDRDGYRRGVEAALAKLGCPDREATVFDSEIECVRFDIRDHIRALLAQEESRG